MSLAVLVTQVVMVVVISLFHAVLARLFIRLFAKVTVPFGTAYLYVLVSNMSQFTLVFVVGLIMARAGGSPEQVFLPLTIISFLLGAAILGFIPKGANGQTIGSGQGCLVQICSALLIIVPIGIGMWFISM